MKTTAALRLCASADYVIAQANIEELHLMFLKYIIAQVIQTEDVSKSRDRKIQIGKMAEKYRSVVGVVTLYDNLTKSKNTSLLRRADDFTTLL